MADTPTLAEVIRRAIDARMIDVHTALPGRVESYDAATQTADVKPLIKRVIRTRQGAPVEEPLPVIPNIPVVFPGAGEFFISFPVQVGDTGLIIFCERNLDRWREVEGEDVNPGDQSMHPLSGATFHPGLRPSNQALGDADGTNMAFGKDGGFVGHVTSDDVELPAGSTEFLARADRVEAGLQDIVDAITNAAVGSGDGGALYKSNMIALLTNPVASTESDKVKGT